MAGILGSNLVTQIGLVVRDIQATKRKYAEFFDVDVPPTISAGDFAVTRTSIQGKPAPDANCLMAFFDVGPNVQLELIQPNGVNSTWQHFLDTKGEGIHHIAFGVEDTDAKIAACESFGMSCVQRGKYGDGSGEYAYLDASADLKLILETLESYKV